MKENGKQKSLEVLYLKVLIRCFPGHYMLGQSERRWRESQGQECMIVLGV